MKALFLALAAAFSENTIDKTLEAELAETRTPGVALVIVRGDEVLQMFLWVFKKEEVTP